jgi:hypothetical protein
VPGSQGQWFQSIVQFMQQNSQLQWTYWALNGEDSYALLDSNYDSTPVSSLKQSLLASIQSSGGGSCKMAPPIPRNLTATAVSSSEIDLKWSVVIPPPGCNFALYDLYASTDPNFQPSPSSRIAFQILTNKFPHKNLQPSTTYYYIVRAADLAGESGNSNEASAITQQGSSSTCHVTYANQNDWGTGFSAAISIQNTGSSQINGWNLTWTWSGSQQITQSWNANFSQQSNNASLTNAAWNGIINPGQILTGIGFNANYRRQNNNPTTFYVNGNLCQ